ncbi:MAG: AAA family ATPase [Promethearchaeota archaeon]
MYERCRFEQRFDAKACVFVGMPGSGKSLGTEGARKLGVPVLVMGDVVREEASRRGVVHSPSALGKIMIDLRRKYGASVIANACIDKFRKMDSSNVVIDGARSEEEIARFREVFKSVKVIAVHASPQTRYQRLVQRKRADDSLTWEDFCERDLRELGIGIGRVIACADVMLINEGEASKLREQVHRLLKDEFGLS